MNTLLHVILPLVQTHVRCLIGYLRGVHVMQGLGLVIPGGTMHDQGMRDMYT